MKWEGVIDMAKLIYPINMSLDGYMEDKNGNIDWSTSDDEIFAFWTEFQRSIGTYLYGRRMYESMVYWETAAPQTPVNFSGEEQPEKMQEFAQTWQHAEKIVYSRSLQIVSSARTRVEREFNPDTIRRLKVSSKGDLTIGGSELAGQAMRAGLVDECHLLVHPIILGEGKRALPDHFYTQLKLLHGRRFNSGVVLLHYDSSPK